jgi:Flp pilus assembly protein TadB
MSVILGIFTKLGGIAALMLVITALFGKLLVATGLLLAALKVTIIVIFVALIVMILLAIFVDRSRRRRDAREF